SRGAAYMAIPALDSFKPDPGWSFHDPAIHVFLGVLPQVPNVAALVLREESQLRLVQLPGLVVLDPHHDGTHAVDHLGQVGDDGDQAMGNALAPLGGRSPVDVLCSWLQREPWVVDIGRTLEGVAVEVLELLLRSVGLPRAVGLLRLGDATGQTEAGQSDNER